ncbi:MAG TPA: BTAD domain-containing putative transcriptional regulator, partial [Pyrinomonadaceae bacterium]|nr:BTAD domain-containing putative transcriptional regulator [Pyrinomonadaceae bacterium]
MTRTEQKESVALAIHLLGPFRVTVDERAIEERRWSRRKPKLLVKLLALQPHHQLHREQAMELLWPDLDAEAAANNLHKSIHAARRALEPALQSGADSSFILTREQQITLSAPGRLWIDVEAFEQAAAAALKSADIQACEQALVLYAGDLLLEDPYEDWTTMRRESLRALRQDLLVKLAELYEAEGRPGESIARLKEIVALDAANEAAHRQLMRLYALTGRRQQALHQYEQCCADLQRELAAQPEPTTVALHEQIVAGSLQSNATDQQPSCQTQHQVIDSIAILPLANAGADPNVEYLSDGITEGIIRSLSQLSALRIMAWSTVVRYKSKEVDPQEVGCALGVRSVFTGRVLQLSDRLVVKTELVDARDSAHLWGAQYDLKLSDTSAVEGKI